MISVFLDSPILPHSTKIILTSYSLLESRLRNTLNSRNTPPLRRPPHVLPIHRNPGPPLHRIQTNPIPTKQVPQTPIPIAPGLDLPYLPGERPCGSQMWLHFIVPEDVEAPVRA